MGHSTIPVEECVEISEEKATGNTTTKRVRKRTYRANKNQRFKVSNNFE